MKTQKRRHIKKPYTIFQKGNIIISMNIPIVKYKKRNIKGGKENDNSYLETEIFQNMVSTLAASNDTNAKNLQKYLEAQKMSSDKAALLKFVFSKKNELEYQLLFKSIDKRNLNMRNIFDNATPENMLYTLLSSKVQAKDAIEKIKEEVNSIPTMDEKTKASIINALESGEGINVSSITTGAMNALRNGSTAIASFLAPTLPVNSSNKKKWNETNVEILFYDQDHLHYRKGDSQPAIEDSETRFGDFVVINRPTKYSSTPEFFKSMYVSVEDLLAHIASAGENVLCMGNTEKCKKYSVKPKPYTRRIIRIVNNQEQVDKDKKGKQ